MMSHNTSLVNQAKKGSLPLFQYMDSDTLAWIRKNNPGFKSPEVERKTIEFIKEQLRKYLPKENWFLRKESVDAIHGLRHIMRVTAYVGLLSHTGNLPPKTIQSSLIGASLHDLRRQNDRGDEKHGKRTADWFRTNINEIIKQYKVKVSQKEIEKIATAIFFHELSYSQITKDSNYLQNKTVVDLIKTADAMDRYRLPKLKWWPKDDFICLLPSQEAKSLAYCLVLESEKNFLQGNKSIESVNEALKTLAMVC